MMLPKLPPVLSRKVEAMWRRRSKVMDDNGEDHLKGQNWNFVETKDNINPKKENLGSRSVDPHYCPSSPSFKFYVLPSVKDKKNNDTCKKDCMNKESFGIKLAENVELRISTKGRTTKMKGEAKGMKMWRETPWGKAIKNLIYLKPCRAITLCFGSR